MKKASHDLKIVLFLNEEVNSMLCIEIHSLADIGHTTKDSGIHREK